MAFPIILCFYFFLLPSLSSSFDPPFCNPQDHYALLQFNNSFSLDHFASAECDDEFHQLSYPKTASWGNVSNCCLWDGVTCDSMSGHVIGVDLSCSWLNGTLHPNSTLFQLSHLQTLNLAHNHFHGSLISSQFGDLSTLTHLNLIDSVFAGEIPFKISHLSKLVSLDLSNNGLYPLDLILEPSTWQKLILNITELSELVLDYVNMSSITRSSLSLLMNFSFSLVSLSLQDTQLQGNLPNDIFYLQNLQKLDLSWNKNLMAQLPKSNWSSPLLLLDLSGIAFSYNNLQGNFPESIFNLTNLSSLCLSSNNLSGYVNLPQFSKLQNLEKLDLSNNKFHSLSSNNNLNYTIPNLQILDLSSCHIDSFPSFLSNLPNLQHLDLSYNKLQGLPESIFGLVNLSSLTLSSNNLTYTINFHHFSKLQNLQRLDLSNNQFLSLSFDNKVANNMTNLKELGLSSCNINSFPKLPLHLPNLHDLDLSNNNIHGMIPEWLNNATYGSLRYLDLSHNMLTSAEHLPMINLMFIDLSFNMLQGNLPVPPFDVEYFLISNNTLNGDIPSSFCNASSLVVLNLSHNNLSGFIPKCLVAFPNLVVLDLQMNKFVGTIPNNFSKSHSLQFLHLNNNLFEGLLPSSLAHCNQLQILDVGANKLEDAFPNWLDGLLELQVLILRENKFHGAIHSSNTKHPFCKLRIFDVSNNHFVGSLPTVYIKKFKGMMKIDYVADGLNYVGSNISSNVYEESVLVTLKGLKVELVRIITTFTTIDLSNNMFDGEIPKEIGELQSLIGLNLSHNRITGSIPQSIANLTNLEWLDLSSNKLKGEIPLALTNLNFLEVLNLSQNQLVGEIPRGNQFATFPNDCYEGNLGLCGFPLSKECNQNEGKLPQPSSSTEDKFGFGWKPVALGYGCGMVFGMLMGQIAFSTGKPQWLVGIFKAVPKKQASRTRKRAPRRMN